MLDVRYINTGKGTYTNFMSPAKFILEERTELVKIVLKLDLVTKRRLFVYECVV